MPSVFEPLQIVDCKKDMVNRGGENVYCVEVENALAGEAVWNAALNKNISDDLHDQCAYTGRVKLEESTGQC